MHTYYWKHYNELCKDELHEILILRQQVFVVEQNCAYLDADEYDTQSFHLFTRKSDKENKPIAAYLRVIEPGRKYPECAIGRVLTKEGERHQGLAKAIMLKSFEFIEGQYKWCNIRISAQLYLKEFYTNLGFITTSSPYDEDGIPHIEMIKK